MLVLTTDWLTYRHIAKVLRAWKKLDRYREDPRWLWNWLREVYEVDKTHPVPEKEDRVEILAAIWPRRAKDPWLVERCCRDRDRARS